MVSKGRKWKEELSLYRFVLFLAEAFFWARACRRRPAEWKPRLWFAPRSYCSFVWNKLRRSFRSVVTKIEAAPTAGSSHHRRYHPPQHRCRRLRSSRRVSRRSHDVAVFCSLRHLRAADLRSIKRGGGGNIESLALWMWFWVCQCVQAISDM